MYIYIYSMYISVEIYVYIYIDTLVHTHIYIYDIPSPDRVPSQLTHQNQNAPSLAAVAAAFPGCAVASGTVFRSMVGR